MYVPTPYKELKRRHILLIFPGCEIQSGQVCNMQNLHTIEEYGLKRCIFCVVIYVSIRHYCVLDCFAL